MNRHNSDLLALYGGTFDPVHAGHLHVATEVWRQLPVLSVHLIPCAMPSHRGSPSATDAQRLKMLELALQDEHGLVLDETELLRGGVSYSFDTLAHYRQQNPNRLHLLVVGWDAYQGICRWHRWRELVANCCVVAVNRAGMDDLPAPELDLPLVTKPELGCRIHLQAPPCTVSSTLVRDAVRAGRGLAELVKPAVADYIKREKIYCES